MSEDNRYALILREPAERTDRRYSIKRFFERSEDLWSCMLHPDFEVQYKDILIGIKTEEISSINFNATHFAVIKDSGESMPVKTLRWMNAWETTVHNEHTFAYISEREFERSIMIRMMIVCLEIISGKIENKNIAYIIECMKNTSQTELIDVLDGFYKSNNVELPDIRAQLHKYFVEMKNIVLIHFVGTSAYCAGVSPGYISAAIKEQIPLEDLFLAYKQRV